MSPIGQPVGNWTINPEASRHLPAYVRFGRVNFRRIPATDCSWVAPGGHPRRRRPRDGCGCAPRSCHARRKNLRGHGQRFIALKDGRRGQCHLSMPNIACHPRAKNTPGNLAIRGRLVCAEFYVAPPQAVVPQLSASSAKSTEISALLTGIQEIYRAFSDPSQNVIGACEAPCALPGIDRAAATSHALRSGLRIAAFVEFIVACRRPAATA
jgi:hypothetical protein